MDQTGTARALRDAMRTGAIGALNHGAGASRNTLDRALDHAPLALDGLGHAPLCGLLLDVARLRLDRLGRLVSRAFRRHRFGDVDRASRKQRSARGSRGQFRQGHFYRHGQALLLHPGRGWKRRLRPHEHVPVASRSDQLLKPAIALTMIQRRERRKIARLPPLARHVSRYETELAANPNEVVNLPARIAAPGCPPEGAFPGDSIPHR